MNIWGEQTWSWNSGTGTQISKDEFLYLDTWMVCGDGEILDDILVTASKGKMILMFTNLLLLFLPTPCTDSDFHLSQTT